MPFDRVVLKKIVSIKCGQRCTKCTKESLIEANDNTKLLCVYLC